MGSGTWSSATYSAVSGAKIRAGATFDYSARATGVHEKLDPKRLNAAGQNIRESRDSDEHPASTPIIVGFDETGSMGSIPRLVLTKLKTLFSLLVDKGYATDPQIAVAAYPATNDHIEAIEVLAAKQTAGADLAITQVFYDPADYVALTNAASYAGVSIPILPGVIPLTDLRRLTRLEALTGVKVPDALRSSLGSASGATLVERGIGATLDLATALLRAGAPGLHLYTFNRTRPALDVISHLRLGGILAGAAPDREVRDAVDRGYLQATPGRGPSFLRSGSPGAAASPRHPVQPHNTITKENA